MIYEELIARADRVRFRTACSTLIDDELACAFCDEIVGAALPAAERLALLQRLFRDLPVYTVLVAALALVPELDGAGRARLFAGLLQSLARERTAAADAVETLLFADVFGDATLVDEAWAALTGPAASEAVLRSVLRTGAQVPWRLKRTLFARLLPDPAWHPQIFLAVRGARHGLFGSTVDAEEALLILERLRMPGREDELESVRRGLGPRR